jgi:uncharacterized protein (DUF1499 family)
MKIFSVILLGTAFVVFMLIRLWPNDHTRYIVDAFTQPAPTTPNFYFSTDTEGALNVPATQLGEVISKMVKDNPRTTLINMSNDGLSQTYMNRTRLLGFPDYISISIRAVSTNSAQIKIFSRSRFGYSDLGVNQRRVQQWLSALRQDT